MDIKKSTFKKPDYWVKRKPTNYLFKRKFFPVCRRKEKVVHTEKKSFFCLFFPYFLEQKYRMITIIIMRVHIRKKSIKRAEISSASKFKNYLNIIRFPSLFLWREKKEATDWKINLTWSERKCPRLRCNFPKQIKKSINIHLMNEEDPWKFWSKESDISTLVW